MHGPLHAEIAVASGVVVPPGNSCCTRGTLQHHQQFQVGTEYITS